MPGQQRLRAHRECVPEVPRKHPAQGRKQQPILGLEPRSADLAAKDRQLVAEHEDLELLRSVTAAEKHDELQQATDDDVQTGHKQRRPPTGGDADATALSAALAPHLIEYLHPTGAADP